MEKVFFILFVLIGAGLLVLGWLMLDLRKKVNIIFGVGKKTEGDFERDLIRRIARSEAKLEEFEQRLKPIEAISRVSVHKVGFIRFNPFQDTGGDNSFVLVMLDRENNGIVLTSYYAREGVKVYAKNIEKGVSKYNLSEEEKKVLEDTISQNPKSEILNPKSEIRNNT